MKFRFLFIVYQWLVAAPILLLITSVVALSTIVLSPFFPDSKFSYAPARFWAKSFCYFSLIKVEIEGLENLDLNQSYIFALNHQSIYDIFVVYGWFPHIFKWIMKSELRKIPLVGKACESAGHIFIDRSSAIAAKVSLEKAEEKLKNGVSLVIFPEGTRTKTGKMGAFKRGAFRIATDLCLPIVPVTLIGSYERMPHGAVNVFPGMIRAFIHEPIDVKKYLPDNVSELIANTHTIMEDKLQNTPDIKV